MKRLNIAALLALTLAFNTVAQKKYGCTTACGDAQDFFIKDNDRVVFLGDSITQQKLYTTYIEAYTLTRFPEYNLLFRNTGWGGDTAWLRKRWKTDEAKLFAATGDALDKMVDDAVHKGLERDVLPLKPTVVTVKFGMNDHAGQPFRPDIFRAYKRSQEELVRTLQQNGARVALLTPQPIEDVKQSPANDPRNLSLRKFSDGLKEIAENENALFVDQFDPYMQIITANKRADGKTVGEGDAVHPGPCGHTLMAWAILKELKAPALVSSAVIRARVPWYNLFSRRVEETSNCTVSNVSYDNGVLTFDRLDKALPMPIDQRALNALKLARINCELNRYPLCLKGLPDGRYAIVIDGQKITAVDSKEGRACINLAKFTTPASEQSAQILKLIFQKNDLYYTRWRNVQLKNPDDPKLAELDRRIADMEQQINELRRPVAHHFEIRPID